MTINVLEAIGSAYWANYLINGDSSGLEDREIALCDKWVAQREPAFVVDVKRDDNGDAEHQWFTWSYGLHTGDDCSGGECLTYILHEQVGWRDASLPWPGSAPGCS